MTDEQKQRKLEANRAYRERQKRKKAQADLSDNLPTPEADERWRTILTDGKIAPLSEKEAAKYVSSREKAEAAVSEAVAREEYIDLLFSKYEKDTCIPHLLQSIIREQIETRVVMTDLLAEILKGVRK